MILKRFKLNPFYFFIERDWLPNTRETLLWNRTWSIFYYENPHGEELLCRCRLYLLPFNKAEIELMNVSTGTAEFYTGHFELGSSQQLYLYLKTKANQQKNLRMEFNIGAEETIQLALGIYQNTNRAMHAAPVMLLDEDPTKAIVENFPYGQHKNGIPDFVWLFFQDTRVKALNVPLGLHTPLYLNDWLLNH